MAELTPKDHANTVHVVSEALKKQQARIDQLTAELEQLQKSYDNVLMKADHGCHNFHCPECDK